MRFFVRAVLGLLVLLSLGLATVLALYWAPDRTVAELSARWAAPPSQFLDVRGMSVHVRVEGLSAEADPEPLVLLHGTSASLHTWDGWVQALSTEQRIIRMDLPGFGLTGPEPKDDYSIQAYVDTVYATLDALQVSRFAIAGNSLGGEIAWNVARAQPERVRQLILIDAAGYPLAPKEIPLGFRVARIPVINRVAEWILPRSVVQSTLEQVYGDPTKVTPELVERYYEITLRAGNRAAVRKRLAQLDMSDRSTQIRALQLPTLVLWGGRDRLIPPEFGARFAADIAGSEYVVFEALGHVPQEEDPAVTAAAARDFLRAQASTVAPDASETQDSPDAVDAAVSEDESTAP